MERLDLSVIDRSGIIVKISDYLEEDDVGSKESDKIKCKAMRELRKLKWDMKEKENVDSNKGKNIAIRGKKNVHL